MKQRSQIKSLSSVLGVGDAGQVLNETQYPCGSQGAIQESHGILGVPAPEDLATCTDAFLYELTQRGLTYRTFCPNCTGEIPASCNRDAQIAATRREEIRRQSDAAAHAAFNAAKADAADAEAAAQTKEAAPITTNDLADPSKIGSAFSAVAAHSSAMADAHGNSPIGSSARAPIEISSSAMNAGNKSSLDLGSALDMTSEEKTQACKSMCAGAYAGHQDQIDSCGQKCVDKFGGTMITEKKSSSGSGLAVVAGLAVLGIAGWFVFGKKG